MKLKVKTYETYQQFYFCLPLASGYVFKTTIRNFIKVLYIYIKFYFYHPPIGSLPMKIKRIQSEVN